jgi:hypothetical protein
MENQPFIVIDTYDISDNVKMYLNKFDGTGHHSLVLRRQNAVSLDSDVISRLREEFEMTITKLANDILDDAKFNYDRVDSYRAVVSGIKIFLVKTRFNIILFLNANHTYCPRKLWCFVLNGGGLSGNRLAAVPIRNVSGKIDNAYEMFCDDVFLDVELDTNTSYIRIITENDYNQLNNFKLKICNL